MTTDAIKSLEAGALASRKRRIALVIVGVGLTLAGFAWCAGSSYGAAKQKTAAYDSVRAVRVDTIRAVETRFVHDTVTMRVATAHADSARREFSVAEASLDSAAARSDSVSSKLVVPAIHTCDAALVADTLKYLTAIGSLADMTTDRNAQRDRADGDEAEMKILKPPRFGFRSGALAGVLAVLTVLHFVK